MGRAASSLFDLLAVATNDRQLWDAAQAASRRYRSPTQGTSVALRSNG